MNQLRQIGGDEAKEGMMNKMKWYRWMWNLHKILKYCEVRACPCIQIGIVIIGNIDFKLELFSPNFRTRHVRIFRYWLVENITRSQNILAIAKVENVENTCTIQQRKFLQDFQYIHCSFQFSFEFMSSRLIFSITIDNRRESESFFLCCLAWQNTICSVTKTILRKCSYNCAWITALMIISSDLLVSVKFGKGIVLGRTKDNEVL